MKKKTKLRKTRACKQEEGETLKVNKRLLRGKGNTANSVFLFFIPGTYVLIYK